MISVIIPLYNKEPIIEKSLQSILSQDYNDFEVIVVNDGSTDKSADIVRSINDDRIHLIEQENGGPSKARNTGIKAAKGEWILFLDADDELLSNSLSNFALCIEKYKEADFIACPFYSYDGVETKMHFPYKDGYVLNAFKQHFNGEFLPRTGAFVCKKELFVKNPFDESTKRFEDLEALFRIYHEANIFLSVSPSMVVNVEFAEASRGRKDIKEDFLGHLNFNGKTFWERMCLYKLYLGERTLYPGQVDKLYPMLKYRYDLLLIYKIINWLYGNK